MIKKFRIICFTVLLSIAFIISVNAESAGSYIYDSSGTAVYSPLIYKFQQNIYGSDLPCGNFSGASDLFVDNNDYIYILDQGNNRVVILDNQYRYVKSLSEFYYHNDILTLNGAKGIYYQSEEKKLYISDTGNSRILITDLDGNVERIIYKPDSDLLNPSLPFSPTKLIVDNLGIIFVLSENVNTGAMIIFADNTFGGFFGVNTIKETADVIQEFLWRKIFSYSEYNASDSYQATEFNNIFWSGNDRCIYTASPSAGTADAEVSKLNAVGNNLLTSTEFGEEDSTTDTQKNLIDVTVDCDGLISVLDNVTGKVYQYDQACNLLGIFGGIGYTNDTFLSPIALECNSKKEILVLDSQKNSLTVFKQTAYGQVLQNALELYNNGQYVESIDLWKEVLRENANLLSAHIGLGKAYLQLGKYETAMEYFKVGQDEDDYSVAKTRMISDWVGKHFPLMAGITVVLFLLIYSYDFFKKRFLAWKKGGKRG